MKQHKLSASKHRDQKGSEESVGLLALGASGPWEVAIDETLTGPARYFAQIEGPSVCLYFSLATGKANKAIEEALDFFVHSRNSGAKAFADSGATLSLAKNADTKISLTRDDESDDRYFLVIEAKSGLRIQLTVADDDLNHIVNALQDAKDDLENDD
jgi:hypothetical protein